MYVAIRPGADSLYDYHLFKVESDGIISVTEQTQAHPDFNHTFAPGEEVIVGNYYNYPKTTREGCMYMYKVDQRTAIIRKQSIIHVCRY